MFSNRQAHFGCSFSQVLNTYCHALFNLSILDIYCRVPPIRGLQDTVAWLTVTNYKQWLTVINSKRSAFYSQKIEEAGNNQMDTFKIGKELFHKNAETPFPEHASTENLANDFSAFFISKIELFRTKLDSVSTTPIVEDTCCGSPPGVMMADTLSFNAKIGLVDFWV